MHEVNKFGTNIVFFLCWTRVACKYSLRNAIVLLYPLIVQAIVFGNSGLMTSILELITHEGSGRRRYSSPQMEMKYICKNIIFDTLQALYYIIWVPIHFLPADNSVHVDFDRYELMAWFYLLANLMYYLVFYLDKRHFEMQFNSHVLGGWNRVYDPTTSESVSLCERNAKKVDELNA